MKSDDSVKYLKDEIYNNDIDKNKKSEQEIDFKHN